LEEAWAPAGSDVRAPSAAACLPTCGAGAPEATAGCAVPDACSPAPAGSPTPEGIPPEGIEAVGTAVPPPVTADDEAGTTAGDTTT